LDVGSVRTSGRSWRNAAVAAAALSVCLPSFATAVVDCIPDVREHSFMEATVRHAVPEEEAYDLVLVGTALGIRDVKPSAWSMPETEVELAVEVLFKGEAPSRVWIPASQPLPTGVTFQRGNRYFVVAGDHAFNGGEPMQVWPCGPTREVSADDVRRLISIAPNARVLTDAFSASRQSVEPVLPIALALTVAAAAGTGLVLTRRRQRA
jgi:hypothetical protein